MASLCGQALALARALPGVRRLSSTSVANFELVKPQVVALRMLDPASTTRYTIVDVREPAMHRRMHIVGALNVPVDQLLNAHSLRDALALMGLTHLAAAAEASRDGAGSKDQGGPPQISRQPRQTLLVHCQLSLIRGPKAAAHLERLIDAERGLLLPVAVLEGGFKGWAGLYGNRNDLVVLE